MNTNPKGRGSHIDPPNRFGGVYRAADWEQVEHDPEYLDDLNRPPTVYFPDDSQSIVTENNSPDVGFRYSVNPYRGCAHGCSYCYARQNHEFLGFSAGLDFETKILVKHNAPELLREFLCRPGWQVEPIAFSGITDPYQPCEREFQITRRCLEVVAEFNQPVSIITKNALVLRDLDILGPMGQAGLVHVNMSVTTLDAELARTMEPRTSAPEARLRAIAGLSDAAIPVRVMVAPIIPGLNDSGMGEVLAAASEAGAKAAAFTLVRLPLTVAPVFIEWLQRTHPKRAKAVLGRIKGMRGGKLNDPNFGSRMRGQGEIAEQIRALFKVLARRHGLDGDLPPYNCESFKPPASDGGQLMLF
jgi:DNA repair photolyase